MNLYQRNYLSVSLVPICLILLILTGCGHSKLEVKVAVLNPDYLEAFVQNSPIEAIEKQAKLAELAVGEGGVLGFANIETMVTQIGQEADKFEEKTIKCNLVAKGTPSLSSKLMPYARTNLSGARILYMQGTDLVEKAKTEPPGELKTSFDFYLKGRAKFEAGSAKLRETFDGIMTELDQAMKAPRENRCSAGSISDSDLAEIEQQFKSAMQTMRLELGPVVKTATRVNQAADFLGDPLLGHVLQAQPEHWQGIYNRAFAGVNGTNSDIAIVMDDVNKFSVKGLRSDSSSATKATFAALGKVMDLAAAVSGVPVAGLMPKGNAGTGDASGELQAEQQQAISGARLQARAARARYDMVRLLDAVLIEGAATLDSAGGTALDNTARTSIHNRLKALAD